MKRRTFLIFCIIISVFAAFTALYGCQFKLDVEKPHEHAFVESVVAPTCTQKGYTLHSCNCGETYTDNFIESTGHSPVEVAYSAPTCSAEGTTGGKRCEVCGAAIEGCEVIEKLPHTVVYTQGKSATCTEDGYSSGASCSVCNEVILERQPIKAKGHRVRRGEKTQNRAECAVCNSYYTPRLGNSAFGYYDFYYTSNGAAKQQLYYDIYLACERLVSGCDDLQSSFAEDGDGNRIVYYPIDEIELTGRNLTNEEAVAVWQVFYFENPAYYWLKNDLLIINKISSEDESVIALVLMADEDYVEYSARAEMDLKIRDMEAECAKYIDGSSSERQKALKIHDYIVDKIDYAYKDGTNKPEDAGWAHSIVGVADKGLGVCEAYAKTFLYLCEVYDVNCVIVAGWANEEHAWNYIQIDGSWYGADLTWDDGKTITYKYFGASETDMSKEHRPYFSQDGYYDLPTLSKNNLN